MADIFALNETQKAESTWRGSVRRLNGIGSNNKKPHNNAQYSFGVQACDDVSRFSRTICVILPIVLSLLAGQNAWAAQALRSNTEPCDVWQKGGTWHWAEDTPKLAPPLLAEPRAAINTAMAGITNKFSFEQRDERRKWVWDISLGHEFGAVGRSKCTENGVTGWGIWLPIDFHMIEELNVETAPVLNTDYRFGLIFRYLWVAAGSEGRPKLRMGLKVATGHESTHVGDEFIILESAKNPDGFYRVNVSYEYIDSAFLMERYRQRSSYGARVGVVALLGKPGFYDPTTLGTPCPAQPPDCLLTTRQRFEPYGTIEFRLDRLHHLLVSTDLRWKIVYRYSHYLLGGRRLSPNAIVAIPLGRRLQRSEQPLLFFRAYRGVNPHGQFRNQLGFLQLGVGVYFPIP